MIINVTNGNLPTMQNVLKNKSKALKHESKETNFYFVYSL